MKLHLTKSLRAAILACVCGAMVSVASAATPTDGKYIGSGDVNDGLWLPSGNTEIIVTDSCSISAIVAFQGAVNDGSYTKLGAGTLTVKGNDSGWGSVGASPTSISVNEGVLVIDFADTSRYNGFTTGDVTVLQGATLKLNKSGAVGTGAAWVVKNDEGEVTETGNGDVVDNITLKGGKLELVRETFLGQVANEKATTKIKLDGGNSTISGNTAAIFTDVIGEGNLTLTDGANVYADIKHTGNLTIQSGDYHFGFSGDYGLSPHVTNDGKITIDSGATVTLSYHGDDVAKLANTGNIIVNGTLVIEKGSVENGGSIEVAGGILRLSSGATIAADKDINVATGGELIIDKDVTLNDVSLDASSLSIGNKTLSGAIALTGANTIKVGTSTATGATLSSTLSGNGSITYTTGLAEGTPGPINVGGTNTYTGGTTISADVTVKPTNADAFGTGVLEVEGVLDLSDVATLNVSGLSLDAGSTLVLGENPLQYTGTLTIQDGAVIDLSAWNYTEDTFPGEDIFTGVTNLVFTDASGNILTGATSGNIKINFGDDVLVDSVLYNAGNGAVRAVPEPTTATLSLLALAGLAARRRRK